MIRKKDGMITEVREKMRGGEGNVKITNIVNKEELKNARLLAYVDIPVGAGIGEHEHLEETEYFIILSGKGQVMDNGIPQEVTKGDVIITGGGASHSIKNIGEEELKMVAVIITY